jgi:hypothetical protein
MSNFFRIILILVLVFFAKVSSFAQCAMCRASVENNVSNGETSIGAGLNTGILYLFIMPYLLAGIIGFFWWKSAKKKKVKLV